jgi:Tol biopolymer transport system component
MLFAFQSCNRDRSSTYRADSFGISAEDFNPSWSPDGNKIVFHSDRDRDYEIYSMNADGTNQTRLTDSPAADKWASWSPNGQKILFCSERDGNREIYIMNTDGSNQTRLTENPAADAAPSWSPDGTKIAFASRRDGNAEIYIMDADGSNPTRLTKNPTADGAPSWSPDGSRIVFFSSRDGNAEIYTMNEDGSNPTRLTDNPGSDVPGSWSPDGTKIVFESYRHGNTEIYIMNTGGSDQRRLTNDPARDYHPSWSPDGRRIAFTSDRDFSIELYVMDVDGSNTVRLTHNAPVNETFGLAPAPQSELDLGEIPYKVVFESFRETDGKENWEICLIDADGSDLINLTNTPEIDERFPHVSPDGRLICFEAVEGEDKESKSRNVYTMNIDGTGRVKITENAYQPCWSGDGRHIAYLPGEFPRYNPRRSANKGLEIYNLEMKKAKRHPNDKIIHFNQLCWSPDGEWFVAAGGSLITAFKADDKTQMYLQAPGCNPDISADGTRLVWGREDWFFNIGTLNFDSSQNNVIDHSVVIACEREYWVYHVDWSPDGNYLAFSYAPYEGSENVGRKAPGSNICICDLRTGKWTQITTDGKHNKEPDWVPVQVH